ncbi:hypothetical protein OIE68_20855 [Nocardia vinacea]|uniref:hypothetical protein n=1 Tax=Nocardia vinacea TaxID=96468 RepID=UPI002E1666C3|nr:hypothetical protein OIE68_20855 [Nocardia vinacea]
MPNRFAVAQWARDGRYGLAEAEDWAAWFFGVNAEGRSLEDIADPLSKADRAAGVVSRHDIVPGGRLGGEEL